jgi:uncharacterized protein (TIGR00299 family) protein
MLAYFDCFAGISGDMTLGAFIDLGVPVSWLKENLSTLPLAGFEIETCQETRQGIGASGVVIRVLDEKTSRNYNTIRSLIENSPLSDTARHRSLTIFNRLARVEAGIHGCPVDEVHFHELGGIDAIVDIVGTALCVEFLKIEKIVSSPIPLGTGFVECAHGTIPVPAPATIGILKDVPVYGTGLSHEMVTPTGAAIVTTLADAFGVMPAMTVHKTGYGAGKRNLKEIPNLLRIITGTETREKAGAVDGLETDRIMAVETCIDDMNPEIFGYTMDRLFEDGALDVYWIPVYMKKNRPGTMVTVLCREEDADTISRRVLSETTTIGVRYYAMDRKMLSRDIFHVDSVYGRVTVKKIIQPDGSARMVPEYEVCQRIALEQGIPLRVVYDTILKAV